jgi:hypothetical protein
MMSDLMDECQKRLDENAVELRGMRISSPEYYYYSLERALARHVVPH